MTEVSDVDTFTKLFLYGLNTDAGGNITVPQNLTDRLRDPDAPAPTVTISMDSYYHSTVGKYLLFSRFGIVENFFNGGIALGPGTYTAAQLGASAGSTIIEQNQAYLDVGENSYFQRAYVFGHETLKLTDSTRFIVSADGSRSLQSAGILAEDDNFDFYSAGAAEVLNTTVFRPEIDPFSIGEGSYQRKVLIDYTGTYAVTSYSAADYIRDVGISAEWSSNIANAASILGAQALAAIASMKSSGVIEYSRDGRDIVYDGKGLNSLSANETELRGKIYVAGSGDDQITGGAWSDIAYGGDGDDTFHASAGGDTYWGGDEPGKPKYVDHDTVTYNDSPAVNIYYDGSDIIKIRGSSEDTLHDIEEVVGSQKNDYFWFSGNISVGRDLTIDSGGGAHDVINLTGSSSGLNLNVDLSSITDTTTGGTITLRNFHTNVFGSAYADQIIDNSSGEKLIDGGDGDDYISASGTVESVTIYGGLGSDTIVGGSGNDILIGGDSTSNSGGDYGYFDTLKGGAGNDRIIASSAWSIIEGGSGDDFTSVNFLQSDMSILTFSASYNGGAGNDYLQIKSDMGGVAYEFNVGDGHDYVSMPAWSWRQDGWTGPTLDIYTDTDLSGVTLIWDTTLDSQYSTTPLKSADLAIVFASGDYIFVPGVSGDFTSYNSAYNHLWGINFVGATISELNMVLGSVDAYRLNPADFEDATSPSDDDITGGDDDDDLKGGSGDDSISGGGGNDLIRESGGNDAIEGGDGSDTVMLFGSRADYTLSSSEAGVLVSSQKGLGGTMRLTNVEYVEFIKDGKTFSVGELTGGVHSNHPPFLASSLSDVNVYRGEQIAITIPAGSFGDPDGEPLSYSAAMADGSALPTWLTFANGQFVGTAPALALGLFGVKVTASDGEATVSDTFFLSVGLQTGVLLTAAEISQVGSGNDRVIGGGASNTWIDGLEGDDWLTADNWAVSLNGNDGDDVLEMLGGGGQVRGGAGSDYFIFDGFSATRSSPNTDWGTIEDFEHGTDKIGIVNGTAGLRSFSAILPFMNQNGDDVAISLKGLPVITIQNVQLTALTADDFWFGDWRTDGGFGPPPTAGIVPWPEITRTISLENGEGSNSSERVIGNGAAYKVIDLMDGNDWITTDAWGVSAYGGRGNDVIELAGMGNYAEGGAGYDYFVFDSSKLEFNPWDPDWARIGDYHDGADKIVFLNGTGGFTDFTGLLPYMSQVGDDVVIALNDLPGITIDTTALSSLDATDFLFVAQPSILEAGFDGQQIKIGSTAGLSSVLANGFAEVKIIGTDLANNLDFSQVTLSGIAVIEGHNGDDRIIGSSGADTILGGNDNDTLMGGQGDDVLTGGDGADLFVFDNLSANTFDTITDFESGWDFLGIDKSVFGAFSENTSGVLDASSFEIGGSATGVDAHIIYNETTGELFYDFDGVGGVSQVQIAVFSGLPSISSDMFVVT